MLRNLNSLSPPVHIHGGLIYITFCMSVCLSLDQNSTGPKVKKIDKKKHYAYEVDL